VRLAAVSLLFSLLPVSTAAGSLAVSHAYYRDTNASLHLLLINRGNEPVTMLPPVVNGFDTASLGRDELRDRDVLWYRCRPNPIPPGEIAELIVVLPAPTDRTATVELRTTSGEKVVRTIPCVPERLRFQAVRFSRNLRAIDVYVRWSDPSKATSLRKILLDGRNVGRQASSWPARCLDGLAYTRINLPRPLERNSYHVVEVEAEDGLSTGCQIRAIPAEFLIGVYGSITPANIEDWAAHGCNHYLSFGGVPADALDLMADRGISVGAKYIPEPLVDRDSGRVLLFDEETARAAIGQVADKPGLLYHHLVDEPDVADYYAGRWLGASAMELAARDEFCENVDPGRYTFVQLDNTFRPANYRVYGEAADVLATHRYSLGSSIRSEAGGETVTRLPFLEDMLDTTVRFRNAVEPRPFFMVPQFFHLGKGRAGRAPTVEEMRLQCYAMIAGGARGLIHYIHSGSQGGGEGSRAPALWDAMAGLHEELKRVGQVVQSGTPAPEDSVTSDSPHVLASAILCGDRMAVILINRCHRSALETFVAVPVRQVKVSVRIPPWIKASALEIVPAEGGAPVSGELKSGCLNFTVDEIKDARCFLLCPKRR